MYYRTARGESHCILCRRIELVDFDIEEWEPAVLEILVKVKRIQNSILIIIYALTLKIKLTHRYITELYTNYIV